MAPPRHLIISAIVVNDNDDVLLAHYSKLGRWHYPHGHLEPHEKNPAVAAQRIVLAHTGVTAEAVKRAFVLNRSGVVDVQVPPFLMLREPGHHTELVYALHAATTKLTADHAGVDGVSWVSPDDVSSLDTTAEVRDLAAWAVEWMNRNNAMSARS